VGQAGLGPLIGNLHVSLPELRVHLVGHSIGARLVSYALLGLPDAATSASPVHSLVLLQGMLSAYAFASSLPDEPRLAGALANTLRRVNGPVVATYSRKDVPARVFFPLLARMARDADVSGSGPVGSAALAYDGAHGVSATRGELGPVGQQYSFERGTITNVDTASVITSHQDVLAAEVVWLVLAAAGIIEP